jgi:Lar family restriction alleviation protein
MVTNDKSCPFCGGDAEEWVYDEGKGPMYFVSCQTKGCDAHQTSIVSADEAMEKWNRRAALEGGGHA